MYIMIQGVPKFKNVCGNELQGVTGFNTGCLLLWSQISKSKNVLKLCFFLNIMLKLREPWLTGNVASIQQNGDFKQITDYLQI